MWELLYLKTKYDEYKIENFYNKKKTKKVSTSFIIVFLLIILFAYFMVFRLAWNCYSNIPFFPRLIICCICVMFAFWFLLYYLIVHILFKIKCSKRIV